MLDSIKINTLANLNDNWKLLNLSNGNFLQATVVTISLQTILGNADSVKTISLQAKDSLGNNMNNIFNDKETKIGKQNGFLQIYNLLEFPSDTIPYSLVGKSNLDVGIVNLTAKEIFDFN